MLCVGVSSGLEAVKICYSKATGHHQHHVNTADTSMLISINGLSHRSLSSAVWQRQEEQEY